MKHFLAVGMVLGPFVPYDQFMSSNCNCHMVSSFHNIEYSKKYFAI